MKQCSCCREYKEKECFSKDPKRKDGYYVYCKECVNKKYRKYYEDNKEKIREKHKQYNKDNKEKINEHNRQKYHKNKEKNSERKKIYRIKNPEKIKEQNKRYEQNNKEKIRERKRKYCAKNKEKINKRSKEYRNRPEIKKRNEEKRKEKYNNDPFYRIRENISGMIWGALKRQNISKGNTSCLKYLPYTIEQLKEHLELQFEPWMSWENYGGKANDERKTWWIDHIIPQSILPYDSMEHLNFQKCWALENLRPLEKLENIKKGNKILEEINKND